MPEGPRRQQRIAGTRAPQRRSGRCHPICRLWRAADWQRCLESYSEAHPDTDGALSSHHGAAGLLSEISRPARQVSVERWLNANMVKKATLITRSISVLTRVCAVAGENKIV